MRKYLRSAVIFLTCAAAMYTLTGCVHTATNKTALMGDIQIPYIRIPELTQSEAERYIDQYGLSDNLEATDKTLEILGGLDEWPDRMFEFILLLPAEQITDEIYNKLANAFLYALDYDQMARFLELCFDTYENSEDSKYILLKGNTIKLESIRCQMELLLKDGEYNDRDALDKYGIFASAKYIPALINEKPAGFQAFNIAGNINTRDYYYEGNDKNYTFVLNSLILSYTSINQDGGSEIPHNVTVYQTAFDSSQLMNLYSFFLDISYDQIEEALNANNSHLLEEIKRDTSYEGWFIGMCGDFGYAYTKIVFSDVSIGPVRMVFPKEPSANAFYIGEEINEQEGEGVIICAEPWWDE